MSIYAAVSSGSYSPSYSYGYAYSKIDLIVSIVSLIISLIVALVFATIGSRKAEEKGYSKGGWWCLIFFCGIIPFIIICCLPDISAQTQTLSSRWVCALISGKQHIMINGIIPQKNIKHHQPPLL